MKLSFRYFVLGIVVFLLIGVIASACVGVLPFFGDGEEPYRRVANLEYVENDPHLRHKLDLYLPDTDADNSAPLPVVLWVHGGSWHIGNKLGIPAGMRDFLVGNGIVLASMNYRYVSQAPPPAQIHDVKTAVRFLRAHAEEYNLDPERIMVAGFSAGGFLASFLGLSAGNAEFEGSELGYSQYSSNVSAVATMATPFSFDADSEWSGVYDVVGLDWEQSFWLFAGCYDLSTCPEEVAKYSPVNYISPSSVPFYVQHGALDLVIPLSQSQDMCALMQEMGLECVLDVQGDTFHDAIVTREFQSFVLEQLGL